MENTTKYNFVENISEISNRKESIVTKHMSSLQVLNVGQGDCCVLHPIPSKELQNFQIIFDTGHKKEKSYIRMNKKKKSILSLSHADFDHINGVEGIISYRNVKRIWVPDVFDEYIRIVGKILKIDGVSALPKNNPNILFLLSILKNTKNLINLRTCPVYGLYENCEMPDYFNCYNPPQKPFQLLRINKKTFKEYLNKLEDENYESVKKWFNNEIDKNNIVKIFDVNSGLPQIDMGKGFITDSGNSRYNRRLWTAGIFYKLRNLIDKFIRSKSQANYNMIVRRLQAYGHDACTVIKYFDGNCDTSALITGDVSQKVLNRLVEKGKNDCNNIKTNILKIPHHGSRENINQEVIDFIRPGYAIVSYGHHKKYKHPHAEVVRYLQNRNIKTLYTNKVKWIKLPVAKKGIFNVYPKIEFK